MALTDGPGEGVGGESASQTESIRPDGELYMRTRHEKGERERQTDKEREESESAERGERLGKKHN